MDGKTLEDYLYSWGLAMYVEKFKEQKIEDINMLQLLSQEDIKELIPILGHRVKLIAEIKQLKQIIDKAFPTEEQEEVYTLLQSSNEGKTLLLQFEQCGLLDNNSRQRLCNLIINEELRNDPDKKISSARFYQLAYEITQVFKKEHLSVYFIPYTSLHPKQKQQLKENCWTAIDTKKRLHKIRSSKTRPRSASAYSFTSTPSSSSNCPSPASTRHEIIDEDVSENLHG
ncbi:hypothetical protein EVAR_55646_1 [Eumeta japonica]|uniref:SAM domain-containing protein n=1 Tax=Eumeta variegata TaxID=151549 RepID=A0A4C1XZD8_EUMVA|nr:hypothetical protein EVAR_55646_1 [Eumeta japonica]